MLYFAYGSNTEAQLKDRLQCEVETIGKATLPGYRFVYMGRSVKWKCATANAIEAGQYEHSSVWGVLYELSGNILKTLDKFEGVKVDDEGNQVGRYRRVEEQVLRGAEYYFAELYVMTGYLKVDQEVRPPSRDYVLNVVEAALANGFPRDYITKTIIPKVCWDPEVIVPAQAE